MTIDKSKFRAANNVRRGRGLFVETTDDKDTAVFTLDEKDKTLHGVEYVSLRRLYVDLVAQDPTEYTFMIEVFGSYDVWTKVKSFLQTKTAGYAYPLWREEAELKLKSAGVVAIIDEMRDGKASFQAAKYLADKGYTDKSTLSAVEKRQKKKLDAKEAEDLKKVNEDAIRIASKGLGSSGQTPVH